jgi:hypothetical protein
MEKKAEQTAKIQNMQGNECYPVMPIYPVMPMPFDPFCPQFTLSEAMNKGTLFKWLYDPYTVNDCPTPRKRGLFC